MNYCKKLLFKNEDKIMFHYFSLLLLAIFLLVSLIPMFTVSLVIWIITFLFDRRQAILHKYTAFCGSMILSSMPVLKVEISGIEKINKNSLYMIVANHQSQLDILACFRLYCHFKFVSKKDVLKIPFLGWMILLNRYITIRRGYINSIEKMLCDCKNTLQKGSSVLLFPEGTRSKNGEIKLFRPGAFILAREEKIPILPIVINGTHNAMARKNILNFKRHKIEVKVMDEIPYQNFAALSSDETAHIVRKRIMHELNLLRSA